MKLAKSTVFVTHSCNTKNEYTRILGIKKGSIIKVGVRDRAYKKISKK